MVGACWDHRSFPGPLWRVQSPVNPRRGLEAVAATVLHLELRPSLEKLKYVFNEKILNLEGFLWQSDSPFVNDWKRSIRLGFLCGLDLCDR